ncbi:hypothetical protein SBDP2_1690004 [Syntrophobacter sp. SbD2]|nr:hypothetical protein SBDP2_1690004 [Syntrophobacter sp. SbD2]
MSWNRPGRQGRVGLPGYDGKKLSPGVAGHHVGHGVPLASPVNMVVTRNDKVDPVFDKELMELVPCLSEDVESVEG